MKQLLTLSTLVLALFIAQPALAQQQDNRPSNKMMHQNNMKMMHEHTIANMMKVNIKMTNRMNIMMPDTAVVHLTLKNYAFVPDTLRIPAGQPVKIILKNTGSVVHEFMSGKGGIRPDRDGFNKSLFHHVKVHHSGGMVEGGMMEMMQNMNMKGMNMKGMDMASPFMIDVKPGHQASISFTLPASKRGTWKMGCFLKLKGSSSKTHYDLGMHGIVIVE